MFYQQQQQRQQATKAAIQQPLSSRGGGIGGSANPWVAMRDMGTWTQQQKLQQAQYYAATSSSPSATSTMMMMSKAGGNGGGGSIMPTTAGPSTMMLTGRGNTTPTPGSSFTSFGAASASLGATTRHSMTTPPAGQQRSSSFASSPAVSDRHYSAGGMMAHRPSTTTAIAGFGFPPGRADCDKDRVMGTGGPAAEPTKKTVASGAAPPANSGKDGKEPYLWSSRFGGGGATAAGGAAGGGAAYGWFNVIGNLWSDHRGMRHTCDATCKHARWDNARCYFVCALTGKKVSRCGLPNQNKKKRGREDAAAKPQDGAETGMVAGLPPPQERRPRIKAKRRRASAPQSQQGLTLQQKHALMLSQVRMASSSKVAASQDPGQPIGVSTATARHGQYQPCLSTVTRGDRLAGVSTGGDISMDVGGGRSVVRMAQSTAARREPEASEMDPRTATVRSFSSAAVAPSTLSSSIATCGSTSGVSSMMDEDMGVSSRRYKTPYDGTQRGMSLQTKAMSLATGKAPKELSHGLNF